MEQEKKEHYLTNFSFSVKRGDKEKIQEAAKVRNLSTNKFVYQTVMEEVEKDDK